MSVSFLGGYLAARGETRAAYLAVLVAVAAALSLAERAIPMPVPWIKPGLANVVALVLIALRRPGDAVLVSVLRTFVAALAGVGVFSPGHLLSLSGALGSVAVMALLARGPWFSVHGLSLAGAWAHAALQLAAAAVLVVPWGAALALAPVLLSAALASGLLTGWAAAAVLARLPRQARPDGG